MTNNLEWLKKEFKRLGIEREPDEYDIPPYIQEHPETICPYCGQIELDKKDKMLLCSECKSTFGHEWIFEL